VPCAVVLQVSNDQSVDLILLSGNLRSILRSWNKWLQWSTLLDVAACGVSGHFVCGQVGSEVQLKCVDSWW